MKLYWIKAQAPHRVLAVIKHLGLDVECIHLDATTGEHKKPPYSDINPNKKVPTLVDGDTVLWEASAIMAYLCIKAGSDMWPYANPAEQVEVLRWLSWNDCHWNAAVGPYYLEHVVKKTFGMGPPDLEALAPKAKELARLASILNNHLEGRDWVALDRVSIADFQLAGMACHGLNGVMPFEDMPHLTAWLERLNDIPAWKNPWPAKASA